MNDPVNGRDPAVEPVERDGPGPLLWVVLIAAIVLIAWYWFGMRGGEEVEPLPPPAAETPAEEAAADPAIPAPN